MYDLQTSVAAQQLFNDLSNVPPRVLNDDLIVRTLEGIGKDINYGKFMPELIRIVKNEIKRLSAQAPREYKTPPKVQQRPAAL